MAAPPVLEHTLKDPAIDELPQSTVLTMDKAGLKVRWTKKTVACYPGTTKRGGTWWWAEYWNEDKKAWDGNVFVQGQVGCYYDYEVFELMVMLMKPQETDAETPPTP